MDTLLEHFNCPMLLEIFDFDSKIDRLQPDCLLTAGMLEKLTIDDNHIPVGREKLPPTMLTALQLFRHGRVQKVPLVDSGRHHAPRIRPAQLVMCGGLSVEPC
jgi:hypothetical protein